MKNLRKFEMKRNTMKKGGELEGGRRERSSVQMRAGVINETIAMLVMIAIMLSQVSVNGFIVWKQTAIFSRRSPGFTKARRYCEYRSEGIGRQWFENRSVEIDGTISKHE